MNFYPRHVGDYTTATTHLTMLEDGAFNRLLDHYYSRERPLPASIDACCRIARAFTKVERDAVGSVLGQFFTLEAAGYTNRRCDAEITAYKRKREKAQESARLGWKKRRSDPDPDASATQTPDEAGPNGGAFAMRTHSERNATRARPSNQEPIIHESGPSSVGHSQGPTDKEMRSMAEEACRRMTEAGCGAVNPSDRELIQALRDGVTIEQLEDSARYIVDRRMAHSNPFRYAVTTAQDHHRHTTATALVHHSQGEQPGRLPS